MTPSEEALDFEYLAKWLGAIADASARGEVTFEAGLPGGRWVVAEEWPSRAAWLEHAQQRHAIEAMADMDRRARSAA
jgi:quinol monooxygenase YgiN